MKKTIALLLICMTVCLAFIGGVPAHAARAAHAARSFSGDCKTAANNFPGYVSGSSYIGMAKGSLAATAQSGPWFFAFENCESQNMESVVSAASFNFNPLGTLGVLEDHVTVTRSASSITTREVSKLGGFSLFNGFIKVNGMSTIAETTATSTTATSTNKSEFAGITVGGQTFKIEPDPNTTLNLFDYASLTLNKQTITNAPDGSSSSIDLTAIDITILKANSLGLSVGAEFQLGHVHGQFSSSKPNSKAIAEGEGPSAIGQLGGTASTGPWFSQRADETNPDVQFTGLGKIALPPFGSGELVGGEGYAHATPDKSEAYANMSFGSLSLLNNTIVVGGITMNVKASLQKDGTASTYAEGHIGNLSIAGTPWLNLDAPDAVAQIPGIGHAVLNHKVITRTATGVTVELIPIEISVDLKNDFGLPVGFRLRLARAWLCVNLPDGGNGNIVITTPTPSVTPTQTATAAPTQTATAAPTQTATPAPTQTATPPVAGGPTFNVTAQVLGGSATFGRPAVVQIDIINSPFADPAAPGANINVSFSVPDGFSVKPAHPKDWQLSLDPNTGNYVATYVGALPVAPGASLSPIYLVGAPVSALPLDVSATVTTPGRSNSVDLTVPVQSSNCPCGA
ncbi:MAG TPA: choice-of-anchor P family protein [Ktedonosporobacter sp.]|nr:choice-of-anchor P family protein [Ktedonosporobacter sp.]